LSLWNNPPYYLTAYGLAVKHGFIGTEEKWLKSLKGDPGADFTFEKSFDTYAEMIDYYTGTRPSGFVFVGDENDYLVYWWDAVEEEWRSAAWRGEKGDQGLPGSPGPAGADGADGATGPAGADGVSMLNFELVSGTHAAGTFDTYYVRLSNGTNIPVYIYNGADGLGAGDMLKSIYDPNRENKDIFKAIRDAVSAAVTSVNGMHGDVTVNHVELADNLYSPDNQEMYDGYQFRTSGGAASIDSGTAELAAVYGNTVPVGRVAESLSLTSSDADLSVLIEPGVWRDSVLAENSGTYVFNYASGHWKYNNANVTLADYGITVTGVPTAGDTLTVVWQKEVRGTLATAKPTSFQSIGLNQFNPNNKLTDYSIDTSGNVEANVGTYVCWIHAVGGLANGYTVYDSQNGVLRIGLCDEIPTTSTTDIEIVTSNVGTSYVTPDHDCYICVVITDPSTLCVHPKWSGYEDATYEAYAESNITIPTADKNSTALPTASYGMPSVGAVRDELSFDLKQYIKRIGQMVYSAANLATVQGYGVDYDYDSTNIFYVLTSPVVYELAGTVSGAYTADDFGTEEFIGTAVPLFALNIYGQNLRDKLRTDVLTISAQSLTKAQKKQVRQNIGAQIDTYAATAGWHNSFFRGKDISDYITDGTLWKRIGGTDGYDLFEDLYVGDYFLKNSKKYRIAGFDYWYNNGDTACSTHHAVIVPDHNMLVADGSTTHWMHSSNSTSGGYVGTDFYAGTNGNTGKATCLSEAEGVFGNAHILSHREYFTNASTNGYASAGSWYDSKVDIMNEQMVYGCRVFGDVMNGTNIPAAYTIDKSQLPLFALAPEFICNRANWWLRDVVSSTTFAYVHTYGSCGSNNASDANLGVRPAFGIKA